MVEQPIAEIVVISLIRAHSRRAAVARQLERMGLGFRFFDAVDGKEGHDLFGKYNSRKRLLQEPDDMSPGQLGCYASHYLVWEYCIANERPLIVLEDDVKIFDSRFLSFIETCSNLPEHIECIRLFTPSSSKNNPDLKIHKAGDVHIYKYEKGLKKTTGYYIRPSAARKFLAYAQEWTQGVDTEMDQFWKNGVECFGTIPPCVTNDDEFESMIGYPKRPKRAIKVTLYRKWKIISQDFLRGFHNFKFKHLNGDTP